jgi:hypothetical protein
LGSSSAGCPSFLIGGDMALVKTTALTQEDIKLRIAVLSVRIDKSTDPLKRLLAIQERINLRKRLLDMML